MTTESVAILFTDIVGSTELSQRLSPEGADEVRRGHFSILRQALAEAGGTEVKNLGDGLMVVFSSASAALACGVAMQQVVDRDNRGREHPMGLRVGLSGGEVSREDDDYFGDPVVEAARLCALCESGQVLAAHVVRAMAGRRSRHECRSLGELSLKGLPDPVETVEVLWDPVERVETGTPITLPTRLAVRPLAGLIGRETPMAAITDAAKRVGAGEGREVLLVSGEAGMGKTTLVAEAARAAFDAGSCVLFGHCEEDLATPYQLFGEALGHYVTHAPEDQLLAHVEEHGSQLARLVPALASRLPDLPPSKATDSDTERFLLFNAVVGLLATMSHYQPVMLVLDDLQWTDDGSMLLLRHLAAAEQDMRVLILGTMRDRELSSFHPLTETLAALHRQSRVSRIELAGLDDSGVVALLEAIAGYTLDDSGVSLAHAVYRETDGNPFFVSEVLRHLAETGAIYQDATGRWTAEDSLEQMALPDSVRVVIGARVGRLGKDAERVLSVASVIGRDFDLDLLARATRTTDDELLDILEMAAAASLVLEMASTPGHFSFSHALIQHTLYEDLTLTRRARVHRRVAEALEDLCGDRPGARVGELARHWFSATQPIDPTKALDYARQAGESALAALAPADALRYFTQALDLYPQASDPDPVLGIDLAIGLGTAQRQTGDPAYRHTLLGVARRAAELGDNERLTAAALANDRGSFSAVGAIDAEKIGVLEMALTDLPADHPDRALVLSTLCQEFTFGSPLERRRALADEAIALAESTGDDATVVRVLNRVSYPLRVPQLHQLSLAQSATALDRAESSGDPLLLFWAASRRLGIAGCDGDIDEMDRCIEIMQSLAERLDQPTLKWMDSFQRSGRALIAGDVDQAEQLATTALQIANESGEPDAELMFGAQVMCVSWQRGTMGDLVPLIEQMAADNPGVPTITAALATAHAEGNRITESRNMLQTFAATGFDMPLDMSWFMGIVCYAEAAIACQDPKYAMPLFERLAPWADQWSSNDAVVGGPASTFLGGLAAVLGRYDQAEVHFAQAALSCSRVSAKFFAARTDLSWGRMLAERQAPGDIEKAREMFAKALTVAEAHGYGNVERRAAAALRDLG